MARGNQRGRGGRNSGRNNWQGGRGLRPRAQRAVYVAGRVPQMRPPLIIEEIPPEEDPVVIPQPPPRGDDAGLERIGLQAQVPEAEDDESDAEAADGLAAANNNNAPPAPAPRDRDDRQPNQEFQPRFERRQGNTQGERTYYDNTYKLNKEVHYLKKELNKMKKQKEAAVRDEKAKKKFRKMLDEVAPPALANLLNVGAAAPAVQYAAPPMQSYHPAPSPQIQLGALPQFNLAPQFHPTPMSQFHPGSMQHQFTPAGLPMNSMAGWFPSGGAVPHVHPTQVYRQTADQYTRY